MNFTKIYINENEILMKNGSLINDVRNLLNLDSDTIILSDKRYIYYPHEPLIDNHKYKTLKFDFKNKNKNCVVFKGFDLECMFLYNECDVPIQIINRETIDKVKRTVYEGGNCKNCEYYKQRIRDNSMCLSLCYYDKLFPKEMIIFKYMEKYYKFVTNKHDLLHCEDDPNHNFTKMKDEDFSNVYISYYKCEEVKMEIVTETITNQRKKWSNI